MNRRLAWASGKRENDSRWHEIDIWLLDEDIPRYFVYVKYNTNHPHEDDIEFTEYVYELDHAATYVDRIDPTIGVKGYPPHENFRIKQRRLMEAIGRRFKGLAAEAIEQARENLGATPSEGFLGGEPSA